MLLIGGGAAAVVQQQQGLDAAASDAVRRVLKGGGGEAEFDGTQAVRWANPRYGSFDNFEAMWLLYIMSSEDEWETPMFQTMAATSPGHAPVRNDYSPAIFSLLWMFVGAYQVNLFVGVIVDSFDRIRRAGALGDDDGRAAAGRRDEGDGRPAAQSGVRPPANWITKLIFRLVTSAAFDVFITVTIIANIGVMACDYWGIEHDEDVYHGYRAAMHVFINVYYAEATLKILGLGLRGYFGDAWCRFDFFLAPPSPTTSSTT